jgi:hypothetical protein
MVIVNGTIQAKIKTGGGLDADGYPIKPDASWSQPIPCRVTTNNLNNLGKHNGNTFVIASYEVLIESQPFESERVKLTQLGRDLGEFSVLSAECLESVGILKIVV